MIKTLTLIFAICIPTSSFASSLYQCKNDQFVIYSQFSCGADAKPIEVKSPPRLFSNTTDAHFAQQQTMLREKKVKAYQLNRRIQRYEAQVSIYHKRMEKEVDALKLLSEKGDQHASSAFFHQQIAQEIKLVRSKYRQRIRDLVVEISKAEHQQKSLQSSLTALSLT